MALKSINPATGEVIFEREELSDDELEAKLALAKETFLSWREKTFAEREVLINKLAGLLRKDAKRYGEIMTLEMGQPITQSFAQVEKCAYVCEYYSEHTAKFLKEEYVKTENTESYVRFDPIGVVLAVMPWNLAFWQVFRFAAPAITAGNVGIMKHSSNVPQSALAIEELFLEAGFPKGVFQNLPIGSGRVEDVIRDERVMAVTLTGSEYAGSQVARVAGEEIKKTVLELGGSDPFIVLDDADIPRTCDAASDGRLQNAGQSCIAAKRFIVVESRYEEFVSEFKKRFEKQIIGDPMDSSTQVGPLATEKILTELEEQVKDAVDKGAVLVTGGSRTGSKGYFYKPTILTGVTPDMRAYSEELFGPVAVVFSARSENEAIDIANNTRFGLGASIWTKDTARAGELAGKIDAGIVTINEIVASDPRLPFGGVKKSGYGRELSRYGQLEFVNIKTVKIK